MRGLSPDWLPGAACLAERTRLGAAERPKTCTRGSARGRTSAARSSRYGRHVCNCAAPPKQLSGSRPCREAIRISRLPVMAGWVCP
jgi:hypothetical protein